MQEQLSFGKILINPKLVIFNKKNVFAMLVHNPVLPGHILLCPKNQKVSSVRDMEPEDLFEISLSAQVLSQAAQKVVGADSSTISIQEGTIAGQHITHLHVHIIPRTLDDRFQKSDGIYDELMKFDEG